MATYNDIKKIKIGDNTFVFHVPTATEVGALPSSTTIPAITLNGAANTSPSFYAPTTAGTNGYVLKSNGSGAPTWTSATLTDQKLKVDPLTSETLYYPILATGAGTATRQIDSTLNGFTYTSIAGTTSTTGEAHLKLGNNIAEGTINNEIGWIELFSNTEYRVALVASNLTRNRSVQFPDKSGTLATTTDIYESVELTQLEYDALSSTDKSDPKKVYFVKDADPSETSELLDMFYPVGTIYETADSDFNPSLTWGGYWEDEEIKDDHIVEEGTSGIWFYRKWSSGRAECWGYKFTTGALAPWSSHYSCALSVENLPSGLFNSSPYWIVSGRCTTCDTVCGLSSSGGSSTQSPAVVLIRPAAASGNLNFQAFYHATGTWKTYEAPTTIYKWKRIN